MVCKARFIFAAALLVCTPMMLHAAEPTTQPIIDHFDPAGDPLRGVTSPSTMPGPSSDSGLNDEGRPRRGERGRAGLHFMQPYSAKEVADAMQFMQEHSPERYKYIQNLPEGERKTGIQNFAARSYQSWMRLPKDDWQLYAVVMKRVEAEDAIFGLVAQLRSSQARGESTEKQQEINTQLHDKVAALVDIGIKERQLRIDSLSRTIKDEQQKLDADSSDRKGLVDKRLQTILADEKALIPSVSTAGNGQGRSRGGPHDGDDNRPPAP